MAAAAGLRDDLACAICLRIFSDSVTLSCGHSICKECVQRCRKQCPQGPFGCPLCLGQAQAHPASNVQLRRTAQKISDAPAHREEAKHEVPCKEKGESSGQRDDAIRCDLCLEEPEAAAKTCLNCEASLCQAHLGKHAMKSTLKDHVLVEPCDAQALAEWRCSKHGKVLECFCKTDSLCLCMLCCVMGSHKNHEIVTLEEAFDQAQTLFPETLQELRTHETALKEAMTKLLQQEEEVKIEETRRQSQLGSLFGEMCMWLSNTEEKALKTLRISEEQQLSQIQTQILKYKDEKDAVICDIQKLEALRDQKDLLFVKAFTAIQARKRELDPNKGDIKLPRPPIVLDKLTKEATLRLFQQFLSDMQFLFETPPVHEHLTCQDDLCIPKVILEPPPLFSFGFSSNAVPQNTYSYSSGFSSLHGFITPTKKQQKSHQSFSTGCHFWEVDTSNAREWELGICQNNFLCYLQMSRDNYLRLFLAGTKMTEKPFPTALKVVRVELDCRRNTLSFYNASKRCGDPADSLKLIESISIPSNYPASAFFSVSDGSLNLLK